MLADFDTAHCGTIHDAQLDAFGQCLATASADSHIRLWDVRDPKKPAFLADLDSHAGAVHQVAWAPPPCGVLLASASSDGTVIIWSRRAKRASDWQILRHARLERHGAARAVAWAPYEHGIALACASADGTVTILTYLGPFFSPSGGDEAAVEHRWHTQSFKAHEAQACSVSWATPPEFSEKTLGMKGARLATAGDGGIRVWRWAEDRAAWEAEPVEHSLPSNLEDSARDVVWKPWDGSCEWLAAACGQSVVFWIFEEESSKQPSSWRSAANLPLGEAVWKLSWSDVGGILLVSLGGKERRTVLLKQRLDGVWDIMNV